MNETVYYAMERLFDILTPKVQKHIRSDLIDYLMNNLEENFSHIEKADLFKGSQNYQTGWSTLQSTW